ncbi:hypothetical protein PT974_08734 [Cladobotryum mycophilum]|uniref:Uncharacterized protein n=1 Tax=Cladobotryum mycophilum TaxID=491253 RepID=A0ABR0SF43_9HYPO
MSATTHHLRSVSEGSQLPRQSTWDPTAAPALVDVYAKKPLPPLPKVQNSLKGSPVPAPLNIKKKPSRQFTPSPTSSTSGLSNISVETANTSPRSLPNTTPTSAASPGRRTSRASTISSNRRSSKKVLQLIGHDVDVMNGSSPWYGDNEPRLKKKASRSSNRSLDMTFSDSCNSHSIPEDSALPPLEADLDGMSSRNSSWSPSSPLSVAMGPLNGHQPAIRTSYGSSRHSDCESPRCCSLQEESPLGRWDPSYGQFSDTRAAGEYHKFAVELAASIERQSTAEEAFSEPRTKRMSAFLSFSTNAQFSRRRNRPNSIDPSFVSALGGSLTAAEKALFPTTAPVAEEPEPEPEAEPEREAVPRSAFDTDSDDERKSRPRWRRDRGRESPSVPAMPRGGEDSSRPRAWSRTGDQMRDLLASAKDRARGLPTATKGEKRREQMRKEIKVLTEGTVA